MALGILALGHGGGVPGPHSGIVGTHGNTNFALIPDIDLDWVKKMIGPVQFARADGLHVGHIMNELLAQQPYYLIDCGPETALRLCGVFGSTPCAHNLKSIFLTHCHDDHSGGLKALAYRTRFIEKYKPTLVYPEELRQLVLNQTDEFNYLNASAKGSDCGLGSFYHVIQMPRDSTFAMHGESNLLFKINPFPVNHNCFSPEGKPFPAFGYTITTPSGKTVLFSGDTAFPTGMGNFAADLIVHDVQFYNDGSKGDHVHCPYAWLRDAAAPAYRSNFWLTHTGHDLPPEVKADGFAGLLQQGLLLTVE